MMTSSLAPVATTENTSALTTPSRHGRAISLVLAFLLEFGRRWAIEGRILEPRHADLEALRDHGRAHARAAMVQDYNPEASAPDRERAGRYQYLVAKSNRLDGEIRNAVSDLHDGGKASAAKARLVGEMAPVPLLVMISIAVVIAMTMAPSAHDLIFTTLRDDLNWAVSLTAGMVIGVMLVWGVVQENSRAIVSTRAALWGGVILGLGFAALRLAAAEEVGEVIYALGLTAIEIGALVFAEATGKRHRAEVALWHERNEGAADAAAGVEVQRSRLEQLVAEKAAADRAIEDHLVRGDERRELSGDFKTFEAACVQAICAGYFRGIAENGGRAEGYSHGA